MEWMFDKDCIVALLAILFYGIGLYVCLSLFIVESRPDWRVIGCMVLFIPVVCFIVGSILTLITQ